MKINCKLCFTGVLVVSLLFCNALFSQSDENLLASAEEVNVLVLEPTFASTKTNTNFEKRYHYLVARSYFRLLSEAQKSERKLKAQFEQYQFENKRFNREGNATFQNKLNVAHKKYMAHRAMLSGLKSWNLFSEDRTADMLFFMTENEDRIFQMYQRGTSEDKMVTYLIYKLADLYHLEEYN